MPAFKTFDDGERAAQGKEWAADVLAHGNKKHMEELCAHKLPAHDWQCKFVHPVRDVLAELGIDKVM